VALKIFVSSEMKNHEDNERRAAAIEEIRELGHFPVVFEEWPSRKLPEGSTVVKHCKNEVVSSDIFMIIVDDDVSPAMKAEHKAAIEHIGPGNMFYYFTKKSTRTSAANGLWKRASKGYILKVFETNEELRKEIKRSLASYAKDMLKRKKTTKILMDKTIKLDADEEFHEEFELEKGDVITITCISEYEFYAGFFPREEYIRRRTSGIFGAFNFELFTNTPEYTKKVKIKEDDDYYLVIRVGVFGGGVFSIPKIHVKVKCEKYE